MRYISVFSGIEAASVAWGPLGWEPVAFSEVDDFPSAVLAERFPGVPNLGDITKVDWSEYRGAVEIVVGGSPCQSFSIAGNRTGLDGASGLMWEYVRCVREVMPRWLLWENVPGALSSSHGEDFRCLLQALDALGYGLAWRVLDAQFFGVAQRRERVFVVGRLGDPDGPCQVLFEPESLRWDLASSREKRKELASRAGGSAEAAGFRWNAGGKTALSAGETSQTIVPSEPPAVCSGFRWHQGSGAGSIGFECKQSPTLDTVKPPAVYIGGDRKASESVDCAGTLPASSGGFNPGAVMCMTDAQPNSMVGYELCGTVTAHASRGGGPFIVGIDSAAFLMRVREGRAGGGKGPLIQEEISGTVATRNDQTLFQPVGFAQNTRDEVRLQGGDGSVSGALSANPGMKQTTYIAQGYDVRRLTPLECERLQGFPDGWTDVEWKGKKAPDSRRYKAIGNSMCVPVMRWIGERIEMVERGF